MIKLLRFLIFLMMGLSSAFAQDKTLGPQPLKVPSTSHRKAILIGNNNYSTQPALKNCERDVDSMAVVFSHLHFQVYPFKNLARTRMIEELQHFYENLQPQDTVVIYFSGHGVGIVDESFLTPVDVELCQINDKKQYGSLRLSQIIDHVQRRHVGSAVFILDACRNMPELKNCPNRTKIIRGIVNPLYNPVGYFVGYATSEEGKASDNQYDQYNSLFTSEILKHIKKPNIGIRAIFDNVRSGVLQRSQRKQDPKRIDALFGDIVLNPQPIDPLATNTLPKDVEMPCADWEMGQTDVVLRAVGQGRSPQQGNAKNIANLNAQANIARNRRIMLNLVAERYFMQNDDNNKSDWKEINIEVDSIATIVEMANMAVKCQKCQLNSKNIYNCWVGLEVLAKDVVVKFDEKIPKDLRKKLNFDAAAFEKTFEDEWNRIKSNFFKP